MRKRLISICTIVILMSIICLYAWESRRDPHTESGDTTSENAGDFLEWVDDDPDVQYLYDKLETIDFSVQEYSVNTDVYDAETDKEYKTAYLKVLLNQTPIQDEGEREYYFKETVPDLSERSDNSRESYQHAIKNGINYYYMDFDGDGAPELITHYLWTDDEPNYGGPCIMKYSPKDKQVYCFMSQDSAKWEILGSGKLYFDCSTDEEISYGYQEINARGEVSKEMHFNQMLSPDQDTAEYIIYSDDMETLGIKGAKSGKEDWNVLRQKFLAATDDALPYMTYEELFGETLEQLVCERIESIDFSVQEYPVNTDVYDAETDKEYKWNYLMALLNRGPIYNEERGNYYFKWESNMHPEIIHSTDEEYLNILKNSFYYYYMDFDGDGLPELVVCSIMSNDPHFPGPRVLKYRPQHGVHELGARHGGWWKMLGSGQMYYDDQTHAGRHSYGYLEVDSLGEVSKMVDFEQYFSTEDPDWYLVTIDEFDRVEVDEETWNELTRDFFEAEANALSCVSFDDLFSGEDIDSVVNAPPNHVTPFRFFEEIKWNHKILEYDICSDPRYDYENTFLAEYYKDDIEETIELIKKTHTEEELKRWGEDESEWFDMDYHLFDFNDDGLEDYLVCIYAFSWTGSGGNHVDILVQEEGGTFREILSITIPTINYEPPDNHETLVVLDEKTDDFYAIVLPGSNRILRYDKNKDWYEFHDGE